MWNLYNILAEVFKTFFYCIPPCNFLIYTLNSLQIILPIILPIMNKYYEKKYEIKISN